MQKLNQIRLDQTGGFTIPDLRFTSRGLQAGDGWWDREWWLQAKAVSTLPLCRRSPRRGWVIYDSRFTRPKYLRMPQWGRRMRTKHLTLNIQERVARGAFLGRGDCLRL